MANRHFGALGDVWKHLLLAEVLRLNPPSQYWETHAGSLSYPLTRSAARTHGALRFLRQAPKDAELSSCSYLQVLRTQRDTYPGSPLIAMLLLGAGTSYLLCDTDADSVESLRRGGADYEVRVEQVDGPEFIKQEVGVSNADPHDVVVHIDPFDPHERRTRDGITPVELAAFLARRGYRLFYWYGYDSSDERGWARAAIGRLAPDVALWCGELSIPSPFVYPGSTGEWGCGVVLANMTEAEVAACGKLGAALERVSRDDVSMGNDPPQIGFTVVP